MINLKQNPIYVAIDTSDIEQASKLVLTLTGKDMIPNGQSVIGGIKIGLEFYLKHGINGVNQIFPQWLRDESGIGLFLDLKLYDIPNTIRGSIRSIYDLKPDYLTIHCSGGYDMLRAASGELGILNHNRRNGDPASRLLGVTVLTSMNDQDLNETGVKSNILDQVLNLARLADEAGLDGIVCSPMEIPEIRDEFGDGFIIATPGLSGSRSDDQKRTLDPSKSLGMGADILVIGRVITKSNDPYKAALEILTSLSS